MLLDDEEARALLADVLAVRAAAEACQDLVPSAHHMTMSTLEKKLAPSAEAVGAAPRRRWWPWGRGSRRHAAAD